MKLPRHSTPSIYLLSVENAALLADRQKEPGDIAWLSESSFRGGMYSAARSLWNGSFDMTSFLMASFGLIEREYTRAWHEGMVAAGLNPREMNEYERGALQEHIVNAQGFLYDLGLWVQQNNKEGEVKFRELTSRLDLWMTGYNTVYNDALTFASNDPNLVWVLGPAKDHCSSCRRLNGKIKRASVWDRMMIQPSAPPNPYLECGGWRCRCYFEVTREKASPGPIPKTVGFPVGPASVPDDTLKSRDKGIKMIDPEALERTRTEIDKFAVSNGYDPKKIIYESKSKGNIAGEYDFNTKSIHMYPRAFESETKATGVFAHELAHASIHASGLSKLDDAWRSLGKEMNASAFEKAGIISAYHDEIIFWHATKKNNVSANLVLNESFAELSRLDFQGKLDGAPPEWVKFYKKVKESM